MFAIQAQLIFGQKDPQPITADGKSQRSPSASGEGVAFLLQSHPGPFNYLPAVSFIKAFPSGSVSTQDG